MSSYLVERILAQPNIKVLLQTQVNSLEGRNGMLEAITCRDRASVESRMPVRHLFAYIGAKPNTAWLAASEVALDADGFVQTEAACTPGHRAFEASIPGVFAIGDVRAGSTKRLAACVGEGAQVIATIHRYLGRSIQYPAIAEQVGRL
jgi:thioredoxin reductase (NADPH)